MTEAQTGIAANIRMERIERLLCELRYEIERGMIEQDVPEQIGFTFFVPISRAIPNGVVHCEFRTRPVPGHYWMGEINPDPRLKVVK